MGAGRRKGEKKREKKRQRQEKTALIGNIITELPRLNVQ